MSAVHAMRAVQCFVTSLIMGIEDTGIINPDTAYVKLDEDFEPKRSIFANCS